MDISRGYFAGFFRREGRLASPASLGLGERAEEAS